MATATMPNPQAELDKVYAAINKKYGKGTIHKASESVPINHLPFREPNLNYATEGGAPFGRFMALYGDESTGKTRIAYELIAQLQNLPDSAAEVLEPRIVYHQACAASPGLGDEIRFKHEERAERLQAELDWLTEMFPAGGTAVYYNAEQQFDEIYARAIGIDTDRLEIVESTTIEEIVDIMQGLYAQHPLHIIDSTSSASSLLQQKHEVGKSLRGTDARQWKNSLRGSMEFFDPERNMGVLIHQMSTNQTTGGGQAASTRYLRHTSSCSIKFMRAKFLWRKDGVLVEDKPTGADEKSMAGIAEPDGVEVYAKIEKSRTCRPMRAAGLQFDYRRLRFVSEHELANSALYFGMVKQSGTWFAVDGEDKNLGQGLKSVYARLAQDEELCERIMCRLLDYTAE